jgi:cytochrome c oxidase subunit 4
MPPDNDDCVKPTVRPYAYVLVFLALLALTAATVALSSVDLGPWHSTVGLTIAAAKALLIMLFFMHLLHTKSVLWVMALSGLFWLGILLFLTLTDYATRTWLTY